MSDNFFRHWSRQAFAVEERREALRIAWREHLVGHVLDGSKEAYRTFNRAPVYPHAWEVR